ncbi:MAG: hypothetical protein WDN10_00085 [bacterium]
MSTLISFFSTYIFLLSAREVQKQILILGALFALITPFIEHANLADWWSPVFVWDTFFHIEDLLFGFGLTGTALGTYFWISKGVRAKIEKQAVFPRASKVVLTIAAACLMFGPFYLMHIPSFYTEITCMIVLSACVCARVPRMILPAIATGIILTLIVLPGYFVATHFHPGWIQEYWKLAGWPGELFLGVPIGEYVFYLLSGLFIPAFAEAFFAKK